MAKLEKVFREEILRLSRRQGKEQVEFLVKRLNDYKNLLGVQKKQLEALTKRIEGLEKRLDNSGVPKPISETVAQDEIKGCRVSPRLIKIQRKRLKLNQTQFARLVGVSLPTIRSWEQGRAQPRGKNLFGFIAVRGLKQDEAYQRLGLEPPIKPKRGRPKKRARRASTVKK